MFKNHNILLAFLNNFTIFNNNITGQNNTAFDIIEDTECLLSDFKNNFETYNEIICFDRLHINKTQGCDHYVLTIEKKEIAYSCDIMSLIYFLSANYPFHVANWSIEPMIESDDKIINKSTSDKYF